MISVLWEITYFAPVVAHSYAGLEHAKQSHLSYLSVHIGGET